MPKLKLSYFDAHGGRGEPARLALSVGGIAYEDNRIPGTEWAKHKPNMPFGSMPTLEVDGQVLTQCNAINRYLGKPADLYPTDPWQAALCDEVMDAIEDADTKIGATFSMSEEQKKIERPKLASGPLTVFLKACRSCSRRTAATTSPAGGSRSRISKVFVFVRRLSPASSTTSRPTWSTASRPSSPSLRLRAPPPGRAGALRQARCDGGARAGGTIFWAARIPV